MQVAAPPPPRMDFMDMIKTQMMTMTAVSAMNNKGNGGAGNIIHMIYLFIVTAVIDFITKNVLPLFIEKMKKYYADKTQKLIDTIKVVEPKTMEKTASLQINITDTDTANVLGQALLDYVTNHPNTKHVLFRKQNYILNQKEVIQLNEDYYILLKREETVQSTPGVGAGVEQLFEIFSYTQNMVSLRRFTDELTKNYILKTQNKLGNQIFYFNMLPQSASRNGVKDYSILQPNFIFSIKPFHTNRKFSNLFGPEIESISKRVSFFVNNKKWYDEKGIPYTLGILLSGQAGAGKTSTIKCLANETQRHIININLNNDISKTQFENLFFNESIVINRNGTNETLTIPHTKRIYVFEDVDCQSDIIRERSEATPVVAGPALSQPNMIGKLDLSFVLNLLDGIVETPGRIIIMTSNHPKMLDHALIRPGRIDVISDFKKCDHKTIIEMIEFFYDIVLGDYEKKTIYDTPPQLVSPAEMSKIMFENFNDYTKTLDYLKQLRPAVAVVEEKEVS
jgi:hypothetical protein